MSVFSRFFMVVLVGCLSWGIAVPASAQEISGRFLLTTQDGQRVTDDVFQGKVRMVTFGYTFCPDICPTTLSTMSEIMDLLGPDAADVVPIFISIDPKRDTPERLKNYLGSFDKHIIGLTGTGPNAVAMTDAAARSYNAKYEIHPPTNPKEPDNYLVDHSAGLWLMDRDGNFVAKLGYMTRPEDAADRVRALVKGQP